MIKVIADKYIPFLRGRLEPYADISYIHPDDFTPESVKDAGALLIRTRTRCGAQLLQDSSVSFIASGTIGMDQFDLPWCASRGIETRNSPGCNAPGVAQYVWSCLLHLGLDPHRITIGVVGHGNVGSIVAEWGRHLGARVLLCDPPKARRGGEGYMTLAEMLPECDVVTLHTPLTRSGEDATFHLIGERELALMRPGAILINAARGGVVHTEALVESASRGHVRLITDCWEGEPDKIDRRLLDLSLIATPHIAGYSRQGKQRATRMIIESLAARFGLPAATRKGERGIKVWDLPEPYRPVDTITPYDIVSSYDPMADDALLRRDPARFEWERDNYDYRDEPLAGRAGHGSVMPALRLIDSLEQGKVREFVKELMVLFGKYPYSMKLDVELDFERALFALINLTGADIEAEYRSRLGRIDLLLKTTSYLYIFELKRDRSALEAVDQIHAREYEAQSEALGRSIIRAGINFSTEKRNIDAWAVEITDL